MGLLNQAQANLSNEQIKSLKDGYQMGQQIIFNKQIFDSMMADMQQMPPEQMLGQAIVGVMMKVQEGTGPLDLLVATSLGIALMGDLVDAIEQIGVELNTEQKTAAFEVAVEMWLSANAGSYSPEEVQGALQDMTPETPEGGI